MKVNEKKEKKRKKKFIGTKPKVNKLHAPPKDRGSDIKDSTIEIHHMLCLNMIDALMSAMHLPTSFDF